MDSSANSYETSEQQQLIQHSQATTNQEHQQPIHLHSHNQQQELHPTQIQIHQIIPQSSNSVNPDTSNFRTDLNNTNGIAGHFHHQQQLHHQQHLQQHHQQLTGQRIVPQPTTSNQQQIHHIQLRPQVVVQNTQIQHQPQQPAQCPYQYKCSLLEYHIHEALLINRALKSELQQYREKIEFEKRLRGALIDRVKNCSS